MNRPTCSKDECNNLARKSRYQARPFEPYCTRHSASEDYYRRKRVRERGVWRSRRKDRCENPECKWVGDYTPMMLDVDHIDGDKTNNNEENLMTLCANCHREKTWQNKDFLNVIYRQKP